jgi:hypothetical protein
MFDWLWKRKVIEPDPAQEAAREARAAEFAGFLQAYVKPGWVLEPSADPAAHEACTHSKFGGLPYAEAGEQWPACATCHKELTFVAQVEAPAENTLYTFFYCFDCYPWGLSREEAGQWKLTSYAGASMEKYAAISPVRQDEGFLTPCRVDISQVKVLPDWEGLDRAIPAAQQYCRPVADDEPWGAFEDAVALLGCLDDYATLLGGYPRHVQGEMQPHCAGCNREMRFLFQIDSEDEANLMWGDVGLVYLFQCPEHPDQFHLELQCH